MSSLYEEVGGSVVFRQLVDAFYAGVEDDPVLRPLYPQGDLAPARERLRQFLEQYWGGPTTYSETRGHPRLRRRHAQWQIGERERDAWLGHMRSAIDSLDVTDEHRAAIRGHVEHAAFTLVNHHPLP
ncbi:MAG: globin [Actinomycetota bacterium]|nr:globin [Actinomycetota bacterium]